MFFTYVPVVNHFFNMAPLPGIPWARISVSMVITWAVVEVEKALIDPVIVPLMRPLLTCINNRAPKWLKLDFSATRKAGQLRKGPSSASMAPQRKGTMKRASSSVVAAAAHAAGGGAASPPPAAANGKKAEV